MLSIYYWNMESSNIITYKKLKSVILLLIFFVTIMPSSVLAQNLPAWYLVSFTDKNNTPFELNNPTEFLSQKSINRRLLNDIAIDSIDLPVNSNYIDSLLQLNLLVYNTSKWMNAALVRVETSNQLSQIPLISIVDSIRYLAPFVSSKGSSNKAQEQRNSKMATKNSIQFDYQSSNYRATNNRIRMVDLDMLFEEGIYGYGIDIAVFDNGFRNVDKLDAFEHLFDNNQIKETRNFTNDGKDLYSSGSHGTGVLSTMAAVISNKFIGSAPQANYYLFQTEDNRYEYPIEEVNWLFAAEYADSLGVDIITSSLVYTRFDDVSLDYTHAQLDGKTAIISRAAHIASLKGIMVFNSAGNEGGGDWQKICFPSDAEGVFTIGAIDKDEYIAKFSSTGNSSDGRIKPDLVAEGLQTPIVDSKGKIVKANGTSFSTPFIAGAAATFLQANPNRKIEEINNAILQSASMWNNADSLMGFGIPNFYYAQLLIQNDNSFQTEQKEGFKVLPNPFTKGFHILFNSSDSQRIDVTIYDMSGKNIYQRLNVQCNKGHNLIRIDYLNDLKAGMYIVKINAKSEVYNQKVIKE